MAEHSSYKNNIVYCTINNYILRISEIYSNCFNGFVLPHIQLTRAWSPRTIQGQCTYLFYKKVSIILFFSRKKDRHVNVLFVYIGNFYRQNTLLHLILVLIFADNNLEAIITSVTGHWT